MNNIRRLGNTISIPITADENAYTGRECPQPDCEGYFKIEFGTGLKGEGLPCHCPYCGHTASHDKFWTKEQIEYAKSVAIRKITDALHKDLKVKPGRPSPIHHYREKQLETEVVCTNCTLRYSVYGVFAFCPDCGQHNSLQILDKNFEVVGKMLDLAAQLESVLAEKLIENALEDCVSAFDGFGRELCQVYKDKSNNAEKAGKLSFQTLETARFVIHKLFKINMARKLSSDEWKSANSGFQKRHLISHKMGVIDQEYIMKTGDTRAILGHKISVEVDEVEKLLHIISKIASTLSDDLKGVD